MKKIMKNYVIRKVFRLSENSKGTVLCLPNWIRRIAIYSEFLRKLVEVEIELEYSEDLELTIYEALS